MENQSLTEYCKWLSDFQSVDTINSCKLEQYIKDYANQQVIEELGLLAEDFYTDRHGDEYIELKDLKDRIKELNK
jgi:hypothetical protein